MQSIVCVSGDEWGKTQPDSYWSPSTWDDVTVEEAERLGDAVVFRFEQMARRAGARVSWFPAQSEVVGPPDCPLNAAQLTELRDQAALWVRYHAPRKRQALSDEDVTSLAKVLFNAGEAQFTDENLGRLCDWATHVIVCSVLLDAMLSIPHCLRFGCWDENGNPTIDAIVGLDPYLDADEDEGPC
jgi:hypothetical protein